MAMTHTFTRTHVYGEFANPYLRCGQCRAWITGWHNPDTCGCEGETWIEPCAHRVEIDDTCPSWSPVDGCLCLKSLGRVDHEEPPVRRAIGV